MCPLGNTISINRLGSVALSVLSWALKNFSGYFTENSNERTMYNYWLWHFLQKEFNTSKHSFREYKRRESFIRSALKYSNLSRKDWTSFPFSSKLGRNGWHVKWKNLCAASTKLRSCRSIAWSDKLKMGKTTVKSLNTGTDRPLQTV